MDDFKKRARDWLYNSTREEFYAVLHEAKISPRQYAICEKRFVDGLMNYQIGMEMNISDKTVERDVAAAYDSVLRVLKSRIKRSPLVYDFVSYTKGLIFICYVLGGITLRTLLQIQTLRLSELCSCALRR